MTPLGQMLVKDGFEKGIERGAGALISICRETGYSYDDTRKKLIEKLESCNNQNNIIKVINECEKEVLSQYI